MKARRLSDKKIHIACETKIFFSGDDGEILIDNIQQSIVYRKIEDGTYYPVLKDRFIAKICGKWGIRKKYVYFNRNEEQDISLEGELVTLFSMDIVFDNPEWHRKWKRDKIISELIDIRER